MSRLVIPSIDLSNGLVVKRVRGVKGSELVKLNLNEALSLVKDYPFIHVVDLNGAELGKPINVDSIAKIGATVNGRCEVGGGVRVIEDAELLLKYCSRVVLGTVAVENPALLLNMINRLGVDKVAVSLDTDGEWLMTRGWGVRARRIMDALSNLPRVSAVIYTNVSVEGTGMGPRVNGELVKRLRDIGKEVYYAGGVSSCSDVEYLWGLGFDGVIIGYALYVKGVRCSA
ncbi:HisA/HisF-related TIM barrel protein [Caldivirga maquilingensis]|uniref:Histidine biosynthesis protein n=1 Tax=Caldivirga maquilingensis (strain ATCC 700844 / DSM 13496 / JCM 10307 / IC-167) TaxID=397948 RepID=A8M908_CALMQ|nr:HisA/HisF-related TIM barrel protein [Caldivirga maquilingensis]ABW02227.1 histidine biosynthesis protein [Caldivirga maquilingensis IC-167]